jgi:hypothetical protein
MTDIRLFVVMITRILLTIVAISTVYAVTSAYERIEKTKIECPTHAQQLILGDVNRGL